MEAHRRSRYGLTSTGGIPPDDYKRESVLPTQMDIKAEQDIFVRPSILSGGYTNKDHYLDVQFRLLKQDFVIPLRQGIREFKRSGMAKHFNSSDLRMYHDVHILGIVATGDGIDHVLKFDISKLKSVRWDGSKRLIFGSLVCLSKDGFETMAVATISNRDARALRYGHVNVNFKSGLDIIFNSTPNDEYVMAETVTFYEAYCHVLEGLQEMSENLPFEEHIVYCLKDVNHPQYLLRGRSIHYDLTTLMKDRCFFRIPDLIKTKWPSSDEMCLNKSQREAAHLALTKRLAVIQGPPGTGKTYVGLKVVETILRNQISYEGNPILVVCYTNHALDQFLEGILEFCDGIIRVGGRSKSTCLEHYNLRNLRKSKRRIIKRSVRKSLKECREELKNLGEVIQKNSKQMEFIDLGTCQYGLLLSVMDRRHQYSLRNGIRHQLSPSQSVLSCWLNLRNDDPSKSVAQNIENNMTKLILRGKFVSHHSELSADMPIEARATLYLKLVSALKSHFQHEVEKLGSCAPPHLELNQIDSYRLKLEVCKREIVPDEWIKLVLSVEQFYMIQTFVGNAGFPNSVIKTWLLGLHKGLHEQLNDTERLQARAYESNSRVQDDFVPEDVKRTAVEDEDDIDEVYFAKTNALRNSFSSIVLRLEKLRLQDDDDGDDDNDAASRVTNSSEVWQQASKPLSFTEQRRKLRRTRTMTSRQETTINDVWGIDMTERFALYKLWLERCKADLASRMVSLVKQYESVLAKKKRLMNQETVCILQNARVIGMTTTGAAKYRSVLQDVGCRIIVVEEAAEVLEAHIVTALNKHCEHLILIGDHQQLRPSPGVYELETKFGLGVSLFERLVNNQFPFVMLQEQHRMRPEISKVMRHIYPDLKDHPVVSSYEHIRGVSKDVFFIQHSESESCVEDTRSKSNNFEASYVTKLCSYLLFQGYDPSQITVLATYTGQVQAIKTCMKECKLSNDVRITTVDNFQGEENDIIILSLVRSNEGKVIGFLKVDNRVCVALSRAKKGLFIIGNFELLSSQSVLWHKILSTARSEGTVGDGLPVVCPNHPDQVKTMFCASDFDSRPLGGCGVPCNYMLKCGHLCDRKCHVFDQLHKQYICNKPCTKRCKDGHLCQRKCSQDCGECYEKIPKVIPSCRHVDLIPCSLPSKDAICSRPCEYIYADCKHKCSGKCGHCRKNSEHPQCRESVQYTWPCGHKEIVECHQKPSRYPCPHPCDAVLDCGHKCKGSCSKCLEGKVHLACGDICGKKLPCGHLCTKYCIEPCKPCSKPCPTKCKHGGCCKPGKKQEICGHICIPCKEPCRRQCKCQTCDNLCSEYCSKQPCTKRCTRTLECQHTCAGICGELCVCATCNEVNNLKEMMAYASSVKKNSDVKEMNRNVATGQIADENVKVKQYNSSWKVSSEDGSGTDKIRNMSGASSNVDQAEEVTNSKAPTQHNPVSYEDDTSRQRHKKPLLFKVPTCDHVFHVEELDSFVNSYEPEGSSFIPCPVCQTPIQRCNRYEHINLLRAKRRTKLKLALMEKSEGIPLDKTAVNNKLAASYKLITNFGLKSPIFVECASEVLALSFKTKLAFVINEINSIKPHEEGLSETETVTYMLTARKEAVLRIGKHVTAQQKGEFIVDLTSCLCRTVLLKVEYEIVDDGEKVPELLAHFTSREKLLRHDIDLKRFLEYKEHAIKLFLAKVRERVKQRFQFHLCDHIIKQVDSVFQVLRSSESKFLSEIVSRPCEIRTVGKAIDLGRFVTTDKH
ncbi:hypothetical protein RRG08_012128 [Elysia crispata]|uniref:NFX1-type zinc finger-containing protein 1 n=1 Tax=Elysia crispata TaxID=231223 RepID=A0AAE1AK66_9GAST|nr:hypothetical protein RRG08_012128 [Elysia crispata]